MTELEASIHKGYCDAFARLGWDGDGDPFEWLEATVGELRAFEDDMYKHKDAARRLAGAVFELDRMSEDWERWSKREDINTLERRQMADCSNSIKIWTNPVIDLAKEVL